MTKREALDALLNHAKATGFVMGKDNIWRTAQEMMGEYVWLDPQRIAEYKALLLDEEEHGR